MSEATTYEDFAASLDTDFELTDFIPTELNAAGQAPVLRLYQVSELQESGPYETFSLIFRGPGDRLLPQQVYRLDHARLGLLEIFLVPVGQDALGISYQAIFNRHKTGR